jgi:glycosyltransferase involved in cell wall biosynthesis
LKVVYLHQYFNTADVAGGTRSYEFARRLAGRGHEVHVVTSSRSNGRRDRTWRVTNVEGINIHAISQPYDNAMGPRERLDAFLRFAVYSAIRARSLRGDIVFATSTPLTIALPAIMATLGRKTPFVMEVRDLWPSVPIALGYLRNPVARLLAKTLERFAYAKASRIIALSQGMADGVASAGFDASRISVIPNLSDTKRFQCAPDTETFYRKHPQLSGRPFIVYTGTFGQVNGVEYMADLAKAYRALDPNLAFVAIGDGGRKNAVAAYAKSIGVLDKNFFLLDPVPKKELPGILAASLACCSWVIPVVELEANSANKLFDAFAAGRPMLINHGGWQSDLLTTTGAGLELSGSSPEQAAEWLYKHASNEAWLVRAREASKELGVSRFEVEQLFGEFEQVLLTA